MKLLKITARLSLEEDAQIQRERIRGELREAGLPSHDEFIDSFIYRQGLTLRIGGAHAREVKA